MYTGDFREEEKLVIKSILNSKYDSRTPEGIVKITKLRTSKVLYILNRSKLLRECKSKKDLWKISI